MIIILADDITGAAEIAGIATSYGLHTQLLTRLGEIDNHDDVLVIASDTRSMTQAEAVRETIAIVDGLVHNHLTENCLFKKTDSALRGHVVPELSTLLALCKKKRVWYLPANPSKGRFIRDGVYYINQNRLDQTDFANDPEFPATSAVLSQRFPEMRPWKNRWDEGILYANIQDEADIRQLIADIPDDTILAGAADLFTALLQSLGRKRTPQTASNQISGKRVLIVCGSTQSKSLGEYHYISHHHIPTSTMPEAVFYGQSSPSQWNEQIEKDGSHTSSLILSIPKYPLEETQLAASAVYLRQTMAEVVYLFVRRHHPQELIIEGGSTAFAILRQLGWDTLHVVNEIAPGVVKLMTPDGIAVTLKPGSYPWGPLFNEPYAE